MSTNIKSKFIRYISIGEKIAVIATFFLTAIMTISNVRMESRIRNQNDSLLKAEAQFNLGNYENVFSILHTIDEKYANPIAQCNLGYLYENGLGTGIDYENAIFYYEAAQAQGNEVALNNLIKLYATRNTEPDREKLCNILKSAYILKQDNIVKFALAYIDNRDPYGIVDDTLYSFTNKVFFDHIEEKLPENPPSVFDLDWEEINNYWSANASETYSGERSSCLITEAKVIDGQIMYHYSV